MIKNGNYDQMSSYPRFWEGGGEWSQPKHAHASNTELFSLQLGPMKGNRGSTAAALG